MCQHLTLGLGGQARHEERLRVRTGLGKSDRPGSTGGAGKRGRKSDARVQSHPDKGLAEIRSPQRKHLAYMKGREPMQTSLRGIAKKAKEFGKYRFRNLYGMLNANLLSEAWKELNKKAAPGVDGVSADDYAKNLEVTSKQL